ncbi:DUF1203 domain-containing protein [Wenjunlia tyrosinilytica]|nr:DUF1203 domain-containing protein [Wenjunlia tyrosinilytica]
MTDIAITALAHRDLDFNSPLSDVRAVGLIHSLRPLAGARILDLGCGWAELLLRLLEAEPTATGVGVDTHEAALERGRANAAARGLSDRVRLEAADAVATAANGTGGPVDVVTAIGVTHAWGGARHTLEAVRPLLRPGGRFLFGEGFWERPPTARASAGLKARPEDFLSLSELVDLAIGCGYRPLAVSVANADEWDSFESRWCGGLERWLLEHPADPAAGKVRAVADEHRDGWLGGYRGVLGFAYLTLAASTAPSAPSRWVHRGSTSGRALGAGNEASDSRRSWTADAPDDGGMETAYEIRAIGPEALEQLRVRDDAGRVPRPVRDDEGGSPLRCCLKRSLPGEAILPVAYAPLRRWAAATGADPGPYEEVGPVFIHPGPCSGPDGDGVPEQIRGERRVCRAYTADGRIKEGVLVDPGHPEAAGSIEEALAELFASPDTALAHVRAVEFGCFTYEARRREG